MPGFGGRMSFTNWVQERRGSNTYYRQRTTNTTMVYIFGILTIEYNNSPVEVEEALVHMDKFITPSLADRTIQKWIHSVHWKVVLTLLRFEELGWGVGSLPTCRTSHSAIL
jgi:hypothetical protein